MYYIIVYINQSIQITKLNIKIIKNNLEKKVPLEKINWALKGLTSTFGNLNMHDNPNYFTS